MSTGRNPFAPFLEGQGFVVLDGGLATALERRGHDLRDALWSARLLLDDPGAIETIHVDYLRAGADYITTSAYQATVSGLQQKGVTREQALDTLRLSTELKEIVSDGHGSAIGVVTNRDERIDNLEDHKSRLEKELKTAINYKEPAPHRFRCP